MKLPRLPRVHAALLALHPRGFRLRFGRALVWMVARRLSEGRRRGRAALTAAWIATAWDLLMNLAESWLDGRSASTWEVVMLESLAREARLAARRLVRARGLAFVSVASLTVAVASGTLVFSLLRSVVLSPLPYPEPDRLVALWETRAGESVSISWPNYRDWRATVTGARLAAYHRDSRNLTGDGPAVRVAGLAMTDALFDVLGVQPLLGRSPRGGVREVALTHELWTTRYGGDDRVVGRTLLLDGEPWVVVGVMPPGIRFPDGVMLGPSDLYLSIAETPEEWDVREAHPGLYAVGRLADGTTAEALRAELDAVAAGIAAEHPDTNARSGVAMQSAVDVAAGDLARPLVLLTIAAGLLALAAVGNVSGLGLADATSRRLEWAVRAALGAGRAQLARTVATEVALLSALGAGSGLAVAALASARLPYIGPFARLGLRPGLGVADLFVGLAVAAVGAFLVASGPVAAVLSTAPGDGRAARASATGRVRAWVVVAQISMATVLLVGSTLLGRSLLAIRAQDGGVRPTGVLAFRLSLPEAEYQGAGRAEAFYRQLSARLAALPGVTRVGGISTLPFSGSGAQSGILPEEPPDQEPVRTDVSVVLPGGLEALGVELLRGRLPDEADAPDGPVDAVVDERLAERFWPGEDPLGRRMAGWGFDELRVVGVIGHVKNYGVTRPSREELYVAHHRRPYLSMWVLLRAETPPAALGPAVRGIVGELDGNLPITSLRVFTDVVDGTVAGVRLAVWLGVALALLTVLLAAVGLRGVVAYGVERRAREFGVRLALGDRAGPIRRGVLASTLRLSAVGLAVGGLLAWYAGTALETLIFGVTRWDPSSWATAATVVLAIAVAAGDGPARRAASVDPASALREG